MADHPDDYANELKGQRDRFCLAVGSALARWNTVEEIVSHIFATAMNPDTIAMSGAALSAFWTVVSFEARIKMTSAAVRARLIHEPGLLKKWDAINNRIPDVAKKRNKLAHGTPVNIHYYDSKKKIHCENMYFVPFFFQTKVDENFIKKFNEEDGRPDNRLTLKQISECETSFKNLFDRLDQFHSEFYDFYNS